MDAKQNAALYGEEATPDSILDIRKTKRPAPFDRLVKVRPDLTDLNTDLTDLNIHVQTDLGSLRSSLDLGPASLKPCSSMVLFWTGVSTH